MSAPNLIYPPSTGGGGGGVSGSGTPNSLPIWSTATSLSDSPLSFSGATLSSSAAMTGINFSAAAGGQTWTLPNNGFALTIQGTSGNGTLKLDTNNRYLGVDSPSGPADKLHIAESGALAFRMQNVTAGVYWQHKVDAAGDWGLAVNGGANAVTVLAANGNVGIGTASPNAQLHISRAGGTSNAEYIRLTNTTVATNSACGITFFQNNAAVPVNRIEGTVSAAGSYDLVSYAWNGSSTAEVMRLQGSTGNVGIGTASPNAQLAVYAASLPTFSLWNATNHTRFAVNAGDCYVDVGFGGAAGALVFRRSSSATESARIDSSGRLLMAGNGTAANPIIANSTGVSGMYFPSATTVAIAANGSVAATFSKVAGAGVALGGTAGLVFDASGTQQGLKLPATPGNTDVQTLDAYNEGLWTPTDGSGAGNTITQTGAVTARYTQIGRQVVCFCDITYPAVILGGGLNASITLPVAAGSNQAGHFVGTNSTALWGIVSGSVVNFYNFNTLVNTTNATLGAGRRLIFTLTYFVS